MRQICSLFTMMMASFTVLLTIATNGSAQAQDDPFILWQTTNIQLLRGYEYELGSEERTKIKLEHANAFKYGDFYAFYDQVIPDEGKSSFYFEPTLRLSLSKITGKDVSFGLIKDVLLTTTMEKPKDIDATWLYGVSADLEIPGFQFFKASYQLRDDPNHAGDTHHTTLVWRAPFKVGELDASFAGFSDLAGAEGTASSFELISPRLEVDLGESLGLPENKLWLGVEWQIWNNKFGIEGVSESVPQLLVKGVF